jgi:hypothetical protein
MSILDELKALFADITEDETVEIGIIKNSLIQQGMNTLNVSLKTNLINKAGEQVIVSGKCLGLCRLLNVVGEESGNKVFEPVNGTEMFVMELAPETIEVVFLSSVASMTGVPLV